LGLFTESTQAVQSSQFAVLLTMATFRLVGFQISIGTYYQSVGLYKKAFLLSLLRQLIVFIPLVFLFARLWKLTGIWWSFPITDVIAAIITIVIFRKDWKKLKKDTLLFQGVFSSQKFAKNCLSEYTYTENIK
jgi:Na+-driven multidrug efflux pump